MILQRIIVNYEQVEIHIHVGFHTFQEIGQIFQNDSEAQEGNRISEIKNPKYFLREISQQVSWNCALLGITVEPCLEPCSYGHIILA